MEEYNLTLKVRNNFLLYWMRESGFKNAAQLARAAGVTQSDVGALLNLKMSAITKKGEVRECVKKICNLLCVSVEDIVPPEHLFDPLVRNLFEANVGRTELARLTAADVEETAMLEEARKLCHETLDDLRPREKTILTKAFGLDGGEATSLSKIAKEYDVTMERILQIKEKAFRKIRHNPEHFKKIHDAFDEI